ncbi:MAG: Clp protease N-terminal domain-containing protein [Ferruginibacter sp.]
MNNLFSYEMLELTSGAREVAIDLGYDYISTIHFFIADCQSQNPHSILKFGFPIEKDFEKFKAGYVKNKVDILSLFNESLPLTKEAENTIFSAETERVRCKQFEIYPWHFFLAAIKNKDSLLYDCFRNENNVFDKLNKYYEESGAFAKHEAIVTKKRIPLFQITKTGY